MFKCEVCKAKDTEIEYLRGLVNRHMMMANPMLYHLERPHDPGPTGYYGDRNDEIEMYDEFGGRMAVNEKELKK